MVHNCAIVSCPLHNRRNIRKGLLFHSFPVDQHRFDLWRQIVLNRCLRTLSINKHSKICHRHFRPDDYIANHTGLTRYLKATAIPSIFADYQINPMLESSIFFHKHFSSETTTTETGRKNIDDSQNETSSLSSPEEICSNTKTRRLLSTIDKLYQIQNANKHLSPVPIIKEAERMKVLTAHSNLSDYSLVVTPTIEADPCNGQSIEAKLIRSSSAVMNSNGSLETFPRNNKFNNAFAKNDLEDELFKFLQQANLVQYYSAFIEQGGDDVKQLAEAQNEDFQEIITLVGMASKPLHVKRFRKALANYRRDDDYDAFHQLSAEEILSGSSYQPATVSMKDNSKSRKVLTSNPFNGYPNKIDDNQRKLIADEAERLAHWLPVVQNRKNYEQQPISKDLLATINLPKDFEDRWQRIRKYAAICRIMPFGKGLPNLNHDFILDNRFDSKKLDRPLTLYEILINEAAASLCFHRTEFLMRREELAHLAHRILQNTGIYHRAENIQKRSLSLDTANGTTVKQIKLNNSMSRTSARSRDSNGFRSMWHNRETKLAKIPIETEILRNEQNKLLQQLKLTGTNSSSTVSSLELKRTIDELGKKIEQLTEEEKNLRRLIRKRNMRIRAKERQQMKLGATNPTSIIENLIVPILPISSSPIHEPIHQNQSTSSLIISNPEKNEHDTYTKHHIKTEKIDYSDQESESPITMARTIEKRREEVCERFVSFSPSMLKMGLPADYRPQRELLICAPTTKALVKTPPYSPKSIDSLAFYSVKDAHTCNDMKYNNQQLVNE